jgi:hypothetical protein
LWPEWVNSNYNYENKEMKNMLKFGYSVPPDYSEWGEENNNHSSKKWFYCKKRIMADILGVLWKTILVQL